MYRKTAALIAACTAAFIVLLQLSLSIATFNLRINERQVNQSSTCYRDFEAVKGNKQQMCFVKTRLKINTSKYFERH